MKGVHPSVCTHHIYIKEVCKPVRQPQRRMNPALKDIVKEELQKLLDAGFIYPIFDSEWVLPLVLVTKKNGKWRICVDYRELNKATKKDHFPLPFIDRVLDGLAGKKFFSFLDGFSGYNQIQISLKDQDKATFTCPWGTFSYRVLPFGLCNAPTTFQRVVLSIFAELVHDSVEIYMDEFNPYGSNFQEALTNLGKVLTKCIEMNLSLSPEKCEFLMIEGTVLGHTVSQQGLQVDPNKIAIIQKVPPPQKIRDVQSFLGLVGYYRRFIKDFSKLASPLFSLLGKDVEFQWTDDCQGALDELKDKLVSAPILRGPDWSLPFHIHTDASNKAIGAYLGQVEEKLPYAIYFFNKNLSKAKMNYTVTEKEFLAIVHSLNKFRHYITGYQTFLHTHHAVIRYLMNKLDVNARIIRWLLLLQQFDLTIVDKPGKENVVVDFLSRLDFLTGEEGIMDDQMPDEHLFAISVLSPWFADIANYLVSAQFPLHLSSNEKSKIVEVTNRALEEILTKVVSSSRKDWADFLVEATWAYNTTWKTTTGFTPYELVYKKKALLSIEFEYNTLRVVAQLDLDLNHAQRERLLQLNGLDEQRMQALLHSEVVQLQNKIWHDQHLHEKQFQLGDWALLYDSRYKDFKGKLRKRWLGPYIVEKCNDNGSVLTKTIDEEDIPMLVSGH
eukprot:PITA_22334